MIEAQLKKLKAMTETEAVEMILHTVTMGWHGLRAPEHKQAKNSRSDGTHNENQVYGAGANPNMIDQTLDI